MKILERTFQKIVHDEDGTGVKVRKALGLDISASEADVVAVINAKKAEAEETRAALKAVKSAAALDRVMVKYNIKQHAEPRTETNVYEDRSLNYVKRSAADAYAAHRSEVEKAARAELARMQKLRASDVGMANTKPKTTDLVDVNERTYDATVKTAYQQLRSIAEQVRAAAKDLTIEEAFSRVYADPRYSELVRREIAERTGSRLLSDDEIPEL